MVEHSPKILASEEKATTTTTTTTTTTAIAVDKNDDGMSMKVSRCHTLQIYGQTGYHSKSALKPPGLVFLCESITLHAYPF